MKIVLAPDSFKGCLTAKEVCDALENGLRRVLKNAVIEKVPMADGGEGTVQSLVDATGGRFLFAEITDPLGGKVKARYGILGDGQTAVIEMAAASGLTLVPEDKRNPLITTTYGTGELIKDAINHGCRKLIIGIGGSATNDGGAGMAQALGARLLDADGNDIGFGGGEVGRLAKIDVSSLVTHHSPLEVVVACDVDNPLCGERGASAVYGPQKGATPEMVKQLDANLAHYAEIIKRDLGKDVKDVPGAGAAGGLGAGLLAFLDAKLRRGVEIVIEAVKLEELVRDADLIITGEGKIDFQTAFGKTVMGVAQCAKRFGVPVIAVGGTIAPEAGEIHEHGVDVLWGIVNRPMGLEEAMNTAADLLRQAGEEIGRMLLVGQRMRRREQP